jgi:hypothetical protein
MEKLTLNTDTTYLYEKRTGLQYASSNGIRKRVDNNKIRLYSDIEDLMNIPVNVTESLDTTVDSIMIKVTNVLGDHIPIPSFVVNQSKSIVPVKVKDGFYYIAKQVPLTSIKITYANVESEVYYVKDTRLNRFNMSLIMKHSIREDYSVFDGKLITISRYKKDKDENEFYISKKDYQMK